MTKQTATYVEIDVPMAGDDLVSGLELESVRITDQGSLVTTTAALTDRVGNTSTDSHSFTRSPATLFDLRERPEGKYAIVTSETDTSAGNKAAIDHATMTL